MPAAVVPLQAEAVHAGTEAFIKDALQVFDLVIRRRSIVGVVRPIEEVRWWQLLRVPHYSQLLPACYGANGVPNGNLRGFVKHNKVELRVLKTRRTVGDKWLIGEGLKAGDKLIVDGLQKIAPGVPVNPVPATPAEKPATPAAVKQQ